MTTSTCASTSIEALGRLHAVEAREALTAIALEARLLPGVSGDSVAQPRSGTPLVAPRLVPLLADELLRAPVDRGARRAWRRRRRGRRSCSCSTRPTHRPKSITDALVGSVRLGTRRRYGAGDHIADLVRRHITATGHAEHPRRGAARERRSSAGPGTGARMARRRGGSTRADPAARAGRRALARRRGPGPQWRRRRRRC